MAWVIIGISMVAVFILLLAFLSRRRGGPHKKLDVGHRHPGYASDRSIGVWGLLGSSGSAGDLGASGDGGDGDGGGGFDGGGFDGGGDGGG